MRKIEEILAVISENLEANKKIFQVKYNDLNYVDSDKLTLLHILCDELYDEEKNYLAIKTLLYYGVDPNKTDWRGYNFIQNALYTGYSENFIIKILDEAFMYNLNINSVDNDGDSIMHTVIYSDDYRDGIMKIYNTLCEMGFDSTILDGQGRNLYDAIKHQTFEYSKMGINLYSDNQIKEFYEAFIKNVPEYFWNKKIQEKKEDKNNLKLEVSLSKNDIKELEKYGKILI